MILTLDPTLTWQKQLYGRTLSSVRFNGSNKRLNDAYIDALNDAIDDGAAHGPDNTSTSSADGTWHSHVLCTGNHAIHQFPGCSKPSSNFPVAGPFPSLTAPDTKAADPFSDITDPLSP